jgi:hypothetical protein
MMLIDVGACMNEFDRTHTIYAAEPWTGDSLALVAYEPDEGGLPPDAVRLKLSYFLEIEIANEILSEWTSAGRARFSNAEICQRFIDYATNDA